MSINYKKRLENVLSTIEEFKESQRIYGGYDYKKFIGNSKPEQIAKNERKYQQFLQSKKEGKKYYKERQKTKTEIDKYKKKSEKLRKERQELKKKIKKQREEVEKENKKNRDKFIIKFIKESYEDKPYDKQFVLNEFRTGTLRIPYEMAVNEDTYTLDKVVREHALKGLVTSIKEEGSNMVRGGLFKYNQDIPELDTLKELVMQDKNWRENTLKISQLLYDTIIKLKYRLQTEEEDLPSEYGDYDVGKVYNVGEGKNDRRFYKEVAQILTDEYKKIIVYKE